MKRTTKTTEKKIFGFGKNLYLVNWSRVANFGYNLIRGDSEQEVIDEHLFSGNDEVAFIVTKIDENNMPVVSRPPYKEGVQ